MALVLHRPKTSLKAERRNTEIKPKQQTVKRRNGNYRQIEDRHLSRDVHLRTKIKVKHKSSVVFFFFLFLLFYKHSECTMQRLSVHSIKILATVLRNRAKKWRDQRIIAERKRDRSNCQNYVSAAPNKLPSSSPSSSTIPKKEA